MKPKRIGKYTSCVCGTCKRCMKNEANRRYWFKLGKLLRKHTDKELDLIAMQDSRIREGRVGA